MCSEEITEVKETVKQRNALNRALSATSSGMTSEMDNMRLSDSAKGQSAPPTSFIATSPSQQQQSVLRLRQAESEEMSKRICALNAHVNEQVTSLWAMWMSGREQPTYIRFEFRFARLAVYLATSDEYDELNCSQGRAEWWAGRRGSAMAQTLLPAVLEAVEVMSENLSSYMDRTLRDEFANSVKMHLLMAAMESRFKERNWTRPVFEQQAFQQPDSRLQQKLMSLWIHINNWVVT